MSSAPDAYFGWDQPGHMPECARPVWEVDTRVDYDAYQGRGAGDHSCPNEDCRHSDRYDRLTVRVVCRSCGVAHLYRGEFLGTETTSTRNLGHGHPPRKVAGLWLYPGAPLLHGDPEPYDYLCGLDRVDRLAPEHVVGYLGQGRRKRGGVIWGAAALPEINDHGNFPRWPLLQYRVTSGDTTFKTVTAGAKWIRDQIRAADGPLAEKVGHW